MVLYIQRSKPKTQNLHTLFLRAYSLRHTRSGPLVWAIVPQSLAGDVPILLAHGKSNEQPSKSLMGEIVVSIANSGIRIYSYLERCRIDRRRRRSIVTCGLVELS